MSVLGLRSESDTLFTGLTSSAHPPILMIPHTHTHTFFCVYMSLSLPDWFGQALRHVHTVRSRNTVF